jgi:hypothetical protein
VAAEDAPAWGLLPKSVAARGGPADAVSGESTIWVSKIDCKNCPNGLGWEEAAGIKFGISDSPPAAGLQMT